MDFSRLLKKPGHVRCVFQHAASGRLHCLSYPVPRYRFRDFILSPRRRMLVHGVHERPLIPRYFDLLVFLIERRHEAVHRRDIFDRVWNDVIVSDSALSQAIRTIRRTLGDDSRAPRFIRTVSRHGYRFVFPDVLEEEDDDEWPHRRRTPPRPGSGRHDGRGSLRASPSARDQCRGQRRRRRGAARSRRGLAHARHLAGAAAPWHTAAARVRARAPA